MSHADYSAEGGDPVPVTPVPLKRTSLTGRATLERRTLHFADIVPLLDSEFPDARENASRTGFRAVLAVPLMREENAYGAIFMWRREAGLFAPDQVALVETFARQIAIAIDNVRLFKATEDRHRRGVCRAGFRRVRCRRHWRHINNRARHHRLWLRKRNCRVRACLA